MTKYAGYFPTKWDVCNMYVKPEERTAYYVVNESFDGKISF